MRYKPELINEIVEELHKYPNVRSVSKKFDIHHSTFYRWMAKHPTFYKEVTGALVFGRLNMCDAAESVIIGGIQRGDYDSAKYFLAHNDKRYMSKEHVERHIAFEEWERTLMGRDFSAELATFEKVFEMYSELESKYDPEFALHVVNPVVGLLCHEDKNLVDIFFTTYADWKKNKASIEEKSKQAGA